MFNWFKRRTEQKNHQAFISQISKTHQSFFDSDGKFWPFKDVDLGIGAVVIWKASFWPDHHKIYYFAAIHGGNGNWYTTSHSLRRRILNDSVELSHFITEGLLRYVEVVEPSCTMNANDEVWTGR